MIRVAITEDDRDLNEAIRSIVDSMPDAECVYSFANAEEALSVLDQNAVDVLVMDLQLPGISGIECTRKLKALHPQMQVLVCTVYDDDERLFESLKAGAGGYLLKSEVLEKLADAIRSILLGEAPMSSGIARRVISFLQQPPRTSPHLSLLSTREKEILDWLGKGYRYKEIAASLHLSLETIRKHVGNIYQKLEVQSRTDALNKVFPKS